jgi:pimeloyl-ACP methyl ester carboxylesterase
MTLPETAELATADGRILRYCLYGPADGSPVVLHGGSPSSRWKWPDLTYAMEQSKLRLLVYDRPGYGGSTRRIERTVADVVDDVLALANAHGWRRFAVFGGSGGGPHALACAALLADRVTRCAVLSGIKPGEPGKPPREETAVRSRLTKTAAEIMSRIDAGGPEVSTVPGPPAREDPDAMARLRATFIDGMDGWVDDSLALAQPWGFEPEKITVPVEIWYGTDDSSIPSEHSEWLLTHIASAQGHPYTGGHLPDVDIYRQIYDWLHSSGPSSSASQF